MSFKPVIFLAFANDKEDNALYLRNLSAEMHGIRNALSEALNKGLCDIVERASASIADIVDVFQDPNYGPRISIFHYGGHANGFSLLLETLEGKKELTHKDGLIPFLAKHDNLKLVFLNGCSSEGQSQELTKAGIPCAIGTITSINDGIATQLAIRFYSGLSDGNTIIKSWSTATDEIKIANGTTELRALFWEGKKESTDRFPWVMDIKPGSESIKDWNLPDISGNPLYGLPEIPPLFNLPESPFLYLNRYERKHAEIFFGRSYYIRSLYSTITDKNSPPILLFYGQSGVGKSSLLDAGLQPRLENSHKIIYLRRNGKIGLHKTLYNALLEINGFKPDDGIQPIQNNDGKTAIIENLKFLSIAADDKTKQEIDALINKLNATNQSSQKETNSADIAPQTIGEAWKRIESINNKPLLVILDQVEEAYTRPNIHLTNEVGQFFSELKPLFGSISNQPLGKIILSFRKEYHPEFDEFCKMYELPRGKFFIEHITKKDVVEIFQGIQHTPKLKARYNINVEDGLSQVIAADLVADQDAPIAPMLQILLTKLWKKATAISSSSPVFTHKLYHELKEEGLAMDEFLHNQLLQIKVKLPALFEIGFVYDLLGFYCTSNSTSAAKNEKQLSEQFPFASKESMDVLNASKELFLITDLGTEDKSAMLAHDTLAKSVVKAQQLSALPLQQAKRVLNSRLEAVRAGSDMATLDVWDLKLLEKVQVYLPAYSEEIKKLMETSRQEIKRKESEKRLLGIFRWAVVIVSVVGAILITWFFFENKRNAKNLFINHMAASSTNQLPTNPTKALQFALGGMDIHQELSIAEIKKAMTHAYYRSKDHHLPWYTELYSSDDNFHELIRNNISKTLIPFADLRRLSIIDYQGDSLGKLDIAFPAGHTDQDLYFEIVKFNQDGTRILTLNNKGEIEIHDIQGKIEKKVQSNSHFFCMDVSFTSDRFYAYSLDTNNTRKGLITVFDMKGNPIDTIVISLNVERMQFSNDGNRLFITRFNESDDPLQHQEYGASFSRGAVSGPITKESDRIECIELTNKKKSYLESNDGGVIYLFNSRSGKILISHHENGTLDVWNDKNKLVHKIRPPLTNSVNTGGYVIANIHPNDSLVAYTFQDSGAYLINIYNPKKKPVYIPNKQPITFIEFSPDGSLLLIGSSDNAAYIWDLQGSLKYTLLGHTNDVSAGFFAKDKEVITTSLDGSVKKWDLTESDDHSLIGHRSAVNYLDINPSGKLLVSCSQDSTMRIWELDQRKEVDQIDFKSDHESIRYVTFINDIEILAIGYQYQAYIYNLITKKKAKLVGHSAAIEWAGTIGKTVITASRDGSVRYWEKTGIPIDTIFPSKYQLLSLDVSDKDGLIAVGDAIGNIFIYDQEGNKVKEWQEHTDQVVYLAFSQNGKYLSSASKDGTAMIWDMQNKTFKAKLDRIICAPYNDCGFISANFSNDSKTVITTSSDRTIRTWDLNGILLNQMIGHTDEIVDAFFSPNDSVIYSYSEDKTLRLWDMNGKEVTTYTGHNGKINCAYLTNDLNHIYSASDDGTIRHWWTPRGVYNKLKEQSQFVNRIKYIHATKQ